MFDLVWQDRERWAASRGPDAVPSPPPDRPVESASLLLWGEHCAECVAPQCYTSCGLYVERRDGRCARFAYGITPNPTVQGLYDFGADIRFRRWAKLESRYTGSPRLMPLPFLRRRAQTFDRLTSVALRAQRLVRSFDRRHRLTEEWGGRIRSWQRRRFEQPDGVPAPDAFYLKFWSPGPARHRMHFEILLDAPIFRRSFPVEPGWNEHVLPWSEIPSSPRGRGRICLWLEGEEEVRLVFTWLEFVKFAERTAATTPPAAAAPAPKVKCVAWDLDGTLWDGTLVESRPDSLRLKPGVADLVRRLDERGILQTVASKNDHGPAWALLEQHGLATYLLHPAIHWGPKSGSLRQIAAALNIDVNTFALVDDSPFERAEVAAALPQVRIYDPATMGDLLAREEFDVPVTAESRARRRMVQLESKRAEIASGWGTDLNGFLRDCAMVMEVGPPSADQKPRCHELLERTNQFNLSGRRYSIDQLDAMLADPAREAFAVRVRDRFGDYGIVGFGLAELEPDGPTITEFVLSCRVAGKTVEDTFFLWYAHRARGRGARRLRIRFCETTRNTPLRQALERLPARTLSQDGAARVLELDLETPVAVPDLVRVEEVAPDAAAGSAR